MDDVLNAKSRAVSPPRELYTHSHQHQHHFNPTIHNPTPITPPATPAMLRSSTPSLSRNTRNRQSQLGLDVSRPSLSTNDDAPSDDAHDAVELFGLRAQGLAKFFLLSVQRCAEYRQLSTAQWFAVAAWWILRGRSELELEQREGDGAVVGSYEKAQEALLKALWIFNSVLLGDDEKRAEVDEDEWMTEELEMTRGEMAKLAGAVYAERGFDAAVPLPQDFDYGVLVDHPELPSTTWHVLSEGIEGAPPAYSSSGSDAPDAALTANPLPLLDSPDAFVYSTMFVTLRLLEDGKDIPNGIFPCVLSIQRKKWQQTIEVVIANQTTSLLLHIQSDREAGRTWHDVQWHMAPQVLEIPLPQGFTAFIEFSPRDFSDLRGILNRINQIYAGLDSRAGEEMVLELRPWTVHYIGSDAQSQRFPMEAIPGCVIRVFESVTVEETPTGTSSQRGVRIAVLTGTSTRTVCCVSQHLGFGVPMQYSLTQGPSGIKDITLTFENGSRSSLMKVTFAAKDDFDHFFRSLSGQEQHPRHPLADVRLRDFTISATPSTPGDQYTTATPFSSLGLDRLQVYPSALTLSGTHGVLSDRTVTSSSVLVRNPPLPARSSPFDQRPPPITLQVIHATPTDLTVSLAAPLRAHLQQTLHLAASAPTTHTYTLASPRDACTVQNALSHATLYIDSHAARLTLARRRLVPGFKLWAAAHARVQIVGRPEGPVKHMYVFFGDEFRHAGSLTARLVVTDEVEALEDRARARWGVRLVDAKYKLGDGFVDVSEGGEYLGEHGDLTIWYPSAEERDSFMLALPGMEVGRVTGRIM